MCCHLTEPGQSMLVTSIQFPLQVPFMRNWFQDQHIRGWTVSAWYKTHSTRPGRGGIVDNGDCVDPSTFYLHTGNGHTGHTPRVVAGIDTSDTPTRVKAVAGVVSRLIFSYNSFRRVA